MNGTCSVRLLRQFTECSRHMHARNGRLILSWDTDTMEANVFFQIGLASF